MKFHWGLQRTVVACHSQYIFLWLPRRFFCVSPDAQLCIFIFLLHTSVHNRHVTFHRCTPCRNCRTLYRFCVCLRMRISFPSLSRFIYFYLIKPSIFFSACLFPEHIHTWVTFFFFFLDSLFSAILYSFVSHFGFEFFSFLLLSFYVIFVI